MDLNYSLGLKKLEDLLLRVLISKFILLFAWCKANVCKVLKESWKIKLNKYHFYERNFIKFLY